MLPVLLQLGPIKIYSMGLMMMLAWIAGMYWWWKMGRDENWTETALFDVYFGATAIFYLMGRLGYVVMHYTDLGGVWGALSILSKPGIIYHLSMIGAVLWVLKFALIKSWEIWKVADSLVVTASLIFSLGSIGMLLNRGELPSDAIQLGVAIVLFGVVSMVRKNFRFYDWYKGDANVARDGLATLVGLILVSIFHIWVGLESQNWWMSGVFGLLGLGLGWMIVLRSGRKIEIDIVQWWRGSKKFSKKRRR